MALFRQSDSLHGNTTSVVEEEEVQVWFMWLSMDRRLSQ